MTLAEHMKEHAALNTAQISDISSTMLRAGVVYAGSPQIVGAALFNPNDIDVLLDYYVDSATGVTALSSSAGVKYHCTGFIPVTPGATYRRSASTGTYAFFDSSRVYVSGGASGATFVAPATAAYVRISVPRTAWEGFAVTLDTGATAKWNIFGNRDPQVGQGSISNVGYLRNIKMKLMRLAAGETLQCTLALAGDSYTQGAGRWSGPFVEYMAAKYGDGGGGYCGFGFTSAGTTPYTVGNQPANKNGNPRPSTYPTMVFGNVTTQYNTESTPDISTITLTGASDYVMQAFPASPVHNACDLFYVGVSGASVQYRFGVYVSGPANDPASYTWGANTVVNMGSAAGSTAVVALSGIPAGAGALIIERVSGAPKLAGVNLKSSAKGVVVHKLAGSGSQVYGWQGMNDVSWRTGFAALTPDLFVYMDGPNSQTSVVSPDLWGGYLDTLVARARFAVPQTEVLVATPPENVRTTNRVSIAAYAKEARLRSVRSKFAYLDHQPAWGDGGNPAAYGVGGLWPLFNADNLHPEPSTGGRLLLKEFLRAIEPLTS